MIKRKDSRQVKPSKPIISAQSQTKVVDFKIINGIRRHRGVAHKALKIKEVPPAISQVGSSAEKIIQAIGIRGILITGSRP